MYCIYKLQFFYYHFRFLIMNTINLISFTVFWSTKIIIIIIIFIKSKVINLLFITKCFIHATKNVTSHNKVFLDSVAEVFMLIILCTCADFKCLKHGIQELEVWIELLIWMQTFIFKIANIYQVHRLLGLTIAI